MQDMKTEGKMTKFLVGKTYSTRSICDYDCIFSFTVLSRTEKTVTITDNRDRTVRRKVRPVNGYEAIDPLGRYSMSPVLTAEDLAA